MAHAMGSTLAVFVLALSVVRPLALVRALSRDDRALLAWTFLLLVRSPIESLLTFENTAVLGPVLTWLWVLTSSLYLAAAPTGDPRNAAFSDPITTTRRPPPGVVTIALGMRRFWEHPKPPAMALPDESVHVAMAS